MKNKLSPLQELRLERSRLKDECSEYEQKFHNNWEYTKGNFGSLAAGTLLSSIRNSIGGLFSFASGKKQADAEDEVAEDTGKSSSFATQMLLAAVPLVWKMVQPMIVEMALGKAKSLFNKKTPKKKAVKKK